MNTSKIYGPVLLSMGICSFTAMSDNKPDVYEPPMVSIPAGDFYMGSDRGRENQKPVHRVSVPAFQMGKYEVTVAEFRKFVEATGYKTGETCNHRIGPRWFGTGPNDGNWENNIYATNEFYPVVCVSRTDAVNYANWLSEQTGKQYRLPTEAEWEYTLRAGTDTRYFFGEDKMSSKACEFANLSDFHAKAQTEKLHGAPYNSGYRIQPCNDKEVLLSVVGLYKPNPYGVHDMLGNVVERLADCYQDSYDNAPTDGSAVAIANCERYVARGGSWHWEAFTSAHRGGIPDDFVAALEGFRLALDTDGKALPSEPGSKAFAKALHKAQKDAKQAQTNTPRYPQKPENLQVVIANNKQVTLRWSASSEKFVTGYRVYRQDPMSNQNVMLADGLKATQFTDTSPLKGNARYKVVALNESHESLPSNIVDSGMVVTHAMPGKVEGEAFYHTGGAEVYQSGMEPDNDKIISAMGKESASYMVKTNKDGEFLLSARVFDSGKPQTFELWLGDQLVATPELKGERGWVTVENIPLAMLKGEHSLSVKGNESMFTVNWFEITPATSQQASL